MAKLGITWRWTARRSRLTPPSIEGDELRADEKGAASGCAPRSVRTCKNASPWTKPKMRRYGADKRGDELPEELADPCQERWMRAERAIGGAWSNKLRRKPSRRARSPGQAEGQRASTTSRIQVQSDHEVGGPRLHRRRTTIPGLRSTSSTRSSWRVRGHPASQRRKGGWCRWCTRWLTDWS